MSKILKFQDEILIGRSAEIVFPFISDGSNEPKWRLEVYKMEVSGPPQLGTEWMEYSKFFRIFETVTPTTVTEFDPPNRIVLETPDDFPSWLRGVREVESQGRKHSLFRYELAFASDFSGLAMPFVPPIFFQRWFYAPRITKYLRNAKSILESRMGGE